MKNTAIGNHAGPVGSITISNRVPPGVSSNATVSSSLKTGDGLFDPGSASLSSDREALRRRIAEALVQVPGPILVTGHTDNQPIRSMRYPSNWHLSQDRANAVKTLLTESVNPPANMKSALGFDGSALNARPRVVPWSKVTVPSLKLPMVTLAVRLG